MFRWLEVGVVCIDGCIHDSQYGALSAVIHCGTAVLLLAPTASLGFSGALSRHTPAWTIGSGAIEEEDRHELDSIRP
jgi:hypothetical protein